MRLSDGFSGHRSKWHNRLRRGTLPCIAPLLPISEARDPLQFAGLWKYIKDWRNVFRHFDRDHSGSIDGRELQQALGQFGYNLSPQLLHLVEKKYGKSSLQLSVALYPDIR